MKKKKIIPLLAILVILFSGCVKKYEYEVVVYHRNPEVRDTLKIETTSYYPNFVLREGTCNMKVIEPNPVFPWIKRTREIKVGYDQEGYSIISGLIKQP